MKRFAGATLVGVVIAAAAVVALGQAQSQPQSQNPGQGQGQGQAAGRGRGASPEALAVAGNKPVLVNKAEYEKWKTELTNWGRWGKEDQLGAINLITPAKRKQAAALVRSGVSVSLSRTAETEKAADNGSPFGHLMTATGANPLDTAYSLDTYTVSYHGWAHTHMDSI